MVSVNKSRLTLRSPLQLLPVYIGSLVNEDTKKDPKAKGITTGVLVASSLLTILAAFWILLKMRAARLPVFRAKRAGMSPSDPGAIEAIDHKYATAEKQSPSPLFAFEPAQSGLTIHP